MTEDKTKVLPLNSKEELPEKYAFTIDVIKIFTLTCAIKMDHEGPKSWEGSTRNIIADIRLPDTFITALECAAACFHLNQSILEKVLLSHFVFRGFSATLCDIINTPNILEDMLKKNQIDMALYNDFIDYRTRDQEKPE